jgi:hypothetical protein
MTPVSTKKVDNHLESLIITGMIVSDRFLQDVQTIYSPPLMAVPFARTVAGWCLDYWKKFGKAPGVHIQDIYNSHARNGLGEDMTALIGKFLESISTEYERSEQFNVDYLLAQAETRFKETSLKNLSEDIQACISQGQTVEAEQLLSEYKFVERPQTTGINPLTDRTAIYQALERREEDTLFRVPGALGHFLGPMERSTLTAIMGSEKKGKSWYLMQFALWGIQDRCNVAFFEVGDMTERDLVRRIHINNTRSSDRHVGETLIPILDCEHNQRNTCTKAERTCHLGVLRRKRGSGEETGISSLEDAPAGYTPCTMCQDKSFKGAVWYKKEMIPPLTWKRAWEYGKRTMRRTGGKSFKLSVHPNSTISVHGIEAILDRWEQQEGFVPDVVIIDYADILAPVDSRMDERGRQNETWKALRALSQKRCCAVITATQANAASYEKRSLSETNFSEDKRKYGHATGFITLNQTPEEKKAGIMRIGRMFFRESAFDVAAHCVVLQNLDIGRPYLSSYLL